MKLDVSVNSPYEFNVTARLKKAADFSGYLVKKGAGWMDAEEWNTENPF